MDKSPSDRFRHIHACSGIIRHIQTHSGIFSNYSGIFRHNTLHLSRHEQVCLSSLNILVHDMINLVYYED